MNTKNIVISIILVLVVAGGVIAFIAKDDSSKSNTTTESQTQLSVADESASQVDTQSTAEVVEDNSGSETPAIAEGQYVVFSETALAASNNENLLFFHASWCPQCISLEEDIKAQGVPLGVTFYEVDYDSNKDLRIKYGVTQQTTIVKVDSNGDKIASFVAYQDPTLASVVDALL